MCPRNLLARAVQRPLLPVLGKTGVECYAENSALVEVCVRRHLGVKSDDLFKQKWPITSCRVKQKFHKNR
jgi:hypothetical protein